MAQDSETRPEGLQEPISLRRQKLGMGPEEPCQPETWGLALSGGGVRSATFCYGLITALARAGAFWRFDLMSTVSGGGYIGAMVGRLAQSSADAKELQNRLAQPGTASRQRSWLRSNSRYLIPRGSRDSLFGIVTFLRNLAGIHVELGVLGIVMGCLLAAFDLFVWFCFDQYILHASPDDKAARLQQWDFVSAWPTLWLLLPLALLGTAIAAIAYWYLPLNKLSPEKADLWRHNVTNLLAGWLSVALWILALGAVDWVAWRLANKPLQLWGLGAAFTVILAVTRAALPAVQAERLATPSALRIGLPAILDLAGRFGLVALMLFWTGVVHAVLTSHVWIRDSVPHRVDFAGATYLVLAALGIAMAWMWMSGPRLDFLNRSSLHHFYRSRLTRAYLGAANPERASDSKVTDTAPNDDVALSQYAPHRTGGPVHLINVCVNQTYQRHGLFNIDRQGELMTLVGPDRYKVECRPWTQLGEGCRETLGTWMSVSGAAVAPGLGSSTRPGYAAMLTSLGIRLGYWWDSQDAAKPLGWTGRRLPKYKFLAFELLGRLPGSIGRIQYLSDGGHSENTGAYPLIAEGCKLIVLADCGADPEYRFDDLENLIRRVRIDLDVNIRFIPRDACLPSAFGTLDELASEKSAACLALARIEYPGDQAPGILVVVKPNLAQDLPEDLYNYSRDNPRFPQESTADQLFGEAQWESYFALGRSLGEKLTAPVLLQLAALAGAPQKKTDPADAPKKEDAADTQRRPARLKLRTATATATLGIGSIIATAAAIGSAIQHSSIPAGASDSATTTLQALRDSFAATPKNAPDSVEEAVARSAERVMTQWRSARILGKYDSLLGDPAATDMLKVTAGLCQPLRERFAACKTLLTSFDCPPLPRKPATYKVEENYAYWARTEEVQDGIDADIVNYCQEGVAKAGLYADLSVALADTGPLPPDVKAAPEPPPTATPSPPPAPPAPAAPAAPAAPGAPAGVPAPSSGPQPNTSAKPLPAATPDDASACMQPAEAAACKGVNIMVQIFGPQGRDNVRALRSLWRAAGALVPPIEDVNDSARRNGRSPPTPPDRPRIVYHAGTENCAGHLAALACQAPSAWQVAPLPARYKPTPRTIEVWLPPASVVAGFEQWADVGGYCYQEQTPPGQGVPPYGVHCHPSRAACDSARGNNTSRLQSPCSLVLLPGMSARIPDKGWAGSRYTTSTSPLAEPFSALVITPPAKSHSRRT